MTMVTAEMRCLGNTFRMPRLGLGRCLLRFHLGRRASPESEDTNEIRSARLHQFYRNYYCDDLRRTALPGQDAMFFLTPFVRFEDLYFRDTAIVPQGVNNRPYNPDDETVENWIIDSVMRRQSSSRPIRTLATLRVAGFFSTHRTRSRLIADLLILSNYYRFFRNMTGVGNRIWIATRFLYELAANAWGISDLEVDSRRWGTVAGVQSVQQTRAMRSGPIVDVDREAFYRIRRQFRELYGTAFISFGYDFPPPPPPPAP
jgi:hypothetical protein